MGIERVEAVITCQGSLSDPEFPKKFGSFLNKLSNVICQDKRKEKLKVLGVEPWNSVRVTFTLPKDAAVRLRQLAQAGDGVLKELGILSVQLEGDQVISLTLAGREPQEIVFKTPAPPLPSQSLSGNSGAFAVVQNQAGPSNGPLPGSSLAHFDPKNVSELLSQAVSLLSDGNLLGELDLQPLFKTPAAPNVVTSSSQPIQFTPPPKAGPSRAAFPFASMQQAMPGTSGMRNPPANAPPVTRYQLNVRTTTAPPTTSQPTFLHPAAAGITKPLSRSYSNSSSNVFTSSSGASNIPSQPGPSGQHSSPVLANLLQNDFGPRRSEAVRRYPPVPNPDLRPRHAQPGQPPPQAVKPFPASPVQPMRSPSVTPVPLAPPMKNSLPRITNRVEPEQPVERPRLELPKIAELPSRLEAVKEPDNPVSVSQPPPTDYSVLRHSPSEQRAEIHQFSAIHINGESAMASQKFDERLTLTALDSADIEQELAALEKKPHPSMSRPGRSASNPCEPLDTDGRTKALEMKKDESSGTGIKLRLKLGKSEPSTPSYSVDIVSDEPRVPPLCISLKNRNVTLLSPKKDDDSAKVKLKGEERKPKKRKVGSDSELELTVSCQVPGLLKMKKPKLDESLTKKSLEKKRIKKGKESDSLGEEARVPPLDLSTVPDYPAKSCDPSAPPSSLSCRNELTDLEGLANQAQHVREEFLSISMRDRDPLTRLADKLKPNNKLYKISVLNSATRTLSESECETIRNTSQFEAYQVDVAVKSDVVQSPVDSNNGNNQGEDSGIESMDALSEKSPNQGESPARSDLIDPFVQPGPVSQTPDRKVNSNSPPHMSPKQDAFEDLPGDLSLCSPQPFENSVTAVLTEDLLSVRLREQHRSTMLPEEILAVKLISQELEKLEEISLAVSRERDCHSELMETDNISEAVAKSPQSATVTVSKESDMALPSVKEERTHCASAPEGCPLSSGGLALIEVVSVSESQHVSSQQISDSIENVNIDMPAIEVKETVPDSQEESKKLSVDNEQICSKEQMCSKEQLVVVEEEISAAGTDVSLSSCEINIDSRTPSDESVSNTFSMETSEEIGQAELSSSESKECPDISEKEIPGTKPAFVLEVLQPDVALTDDLTTEKALQPGLTVGLITDEALPKDIDLTLEEKSKCDIASSEVSSPVVSQETEIVTRPVECELPVMSSSLIETAADVLHSQGSGLTSDVVAKPEQSSVTSETCETEVELNNKIRIEVASVCSNVSLEPVLTVRSTPESTIVGHIVGSKSEPPVSPPPAEPIDTKLKDDVAIVSDFVEEKINLPQETLNLGCASRLNKVESPEAIRIPSITSTPPLPTLPATSSTESTSQSRMDQALALSHSQKTFILPPGKKMVPIKLVTLPKGTAPPTSMSGGQQFKVLVPMKSSSGVYYKSVVVSTASSDSVVAARSVSPAEVVQTISTEPSPSEEKQELGSKLAFAEGAMELVPFIASSSKDPIQSTAQSSEGKVAEIEQQLCNEGLKDLAKPEFRPCSDVPVDSRHLLAVPEIVVEHNYSQNLEAFSPASEVEVKFSDSISIPSTPECEDQLDYDHIDETVESIPLPITVESIPLPIDEPKEELEEEIVDIIVSSIPVEEILHGNPTVVVETETNTQNGSNGPLETNVMIEEVEPRRENQPIESCQENQIVVEVAGEVLSPEESTEEQSLLIQPTDSGVADTESALLDDTVSEASIIVDEAKVLSEFDSLPVVQDEISMIGDEQEAEKSVVEVKDEVEDQGDLAEDEAIDGLDEGSLEVPETTQKEIIQLSAIEPEKALENTEPETPEKPIQNQLEDLPAEEVNETSKEVVSALQQKAIEPGQISDNPKDHTEVKPCSSTKPEPVVYDDPPLLESLPEPRSYQTDTPEPFETSSETPPKLEPSDLPTVCVDEFDMSQVNGTPRKQRRSTRCSRTPEVEEFKTPVEDLMMDIPEPVLRSTRSGTRLVSPDLSKLEAKCSSMKNSPSPAPEFQQKRGVRRKREDSGSSLRSDDRNSSTPDSELSGPSHMTRSGTPESSRPGKRKCSENASELIKVCMGVDDRRRSSLHSEGGEMESKKKTSSGDGAKGSRSSSELAKAADVESMDEDSDDSEKKTKQNPAKKARGTRPITSSANKTASSKITNSKDSENSPRKSRRGSTDSTASGGQPAMTPTERRTRSTPMKSNNQPCGQPTPDAKRKGVIPGVSTTPRATPKRRVK